MSHEVRVKNRLQVHLLILNDEKKDRKFGMVFIDRSLDVFNARIIPY